MTFGWSGKGGFPSRSAARLVAAAGMMAISSGFACATMEVNGDAAALTIVLQDEAQSQIVAALADRLGFNVVGTVADEGVITGRFRGDLAKVLNSVLTQNGFVIIYEGGKPSRLLLSAKNPGGSMAAMPPAGYSLVPGNAADGQLVDPNFPNQNQPENPEGQVYQPDPTEMPVESMPVPPPGPANPES